MCTNVHLAHYDGDYLRLCGYILNSLAILIELVTLHHFLSALYNMYCIFYADWIMEVDCLFIQVLHTRLCL